MLIAFHIYGRPPGPGSLASAITHRFAPLARTAKSTGDLRPLLAAVSSMSHREKAALLEDSMDMWVGLHAMNLAPEVSLPGNAGAAASDSVQALPDSMFFDAEQIAPAGADYRIHLTVSESPNGTTTLVFLVEPIGPGAGYDDLARRCGWTQFTDGPVVPLWMAKIDDRRGVLHSIARLATDADGYRRIEWDNDLIDLRLEQYPGPTVLPPGYLALLQSSKELLMVGPAANIEEAQALAGQGGLVSVRAQVIFDAHPKVRADSQGNADEAAFPTTPQEQR
ncbi:hypothetical protein ACWGNE_20075 [Streptomyces xiamenensis]